MSGFLDRLDTSPSFLAMTLPRTALLLALLLTAGCNRSADGERPTFGDTRSTTDEADDALVGSWSYTAYVEPSEVARLSDDPIPAGVEIDMTVSGSNTYHANGRYDADAEVTIRVRQAGEEVPLRMLRRDAGTWETQGDVLFETVTSGTLTALDPTTKQFLRETPEFSAFVSPIEGETQSSTIHSATQTAVDLEEQESRLRYTLRREE